MSLSINYSRFKINVILPVLSAASIVSMMTSESQPAFSAILERWLAGFEETVKVLILFSMQGLSGFGVMSSQKLGLISALECPCLNDYKFPVKLPEQQRSEQQELSTLEPRRFSGSAAQPVGYSCGIGGN